MHKNIVKPRIHPQGNIDKIFGINVDNIFQIQNSGNFWPDFFLNLYLQIFLWNKSLRKLLFLAMGCLNDIYIDFLAETVIQIFA